MALIDDPWAIDDLQRRVFQKLFSDQVPEGQQEINRIRRQWLVTLLEGVSHDVPRQIEVAAQQLLGTYPTPRPATLPDYGQPSDQVSPAELKEELSQ